ncbi:MAG TPA: lanthionine synthetase LanC family protein [Gemmatimonadaceae bacterium]|nr:lanthionine synthetase LanC family protein [Gemmatimonadaceae bacterium]
MVRIPDRIPGVRRAHSTPASGTLYQGAPGIALFLTELYRCTRETRFLRAAEGGLQHSLELSASAPPWSFGFHAGLVGLAYAFYRFGMISERPESFSTAEALLTPLVGNAERDQGIDVIGGAAGAIPALLVMRDHLRDELTLELARGLGERLLNRARRGCSGWSWGGVASAVQDLTGLAHGASGGAYALLELYNVTGEVRYRYAAEQAFTYERQFYDAAEGNWPDFRYIELSEYLSFGQVAALRARLREGDPLPPYHKTFMHAWCHGAPGIGLARLRAYELLDTQQYADEATAAVETTLRGIGDRPDNYSLCHGYLGNCETLILGAGILGRPELQSAAEHRADQGRAEFETVGRPWSCGTLGTVSDPSLLVGEAGIGYFFLRLSDSSTPCILFLTSERRATDKEYQPRHIAVLRRAYAEEHFGNTIRVIERLQPETFDALTAADVLPGDSEILRIREAIRAHVSTDRERAELFADAFAVEDCRFRLAAETKDLTQEVLEMIKRPSSTEVSWEASRFVLADHVKLVRTRCDWTDWLTREMSSPPAPARVPVITAVYRHDGFVHSRRLSSWTALVLEAVTTPRTNAEIVARLKAEVDVSDEYVSTAVLEQLQAAYAVGLIRCEVTPEPASVLVAAVEDVPPGNA